MSRTPSSLLRLALLGDAAASGATGLLLAAAAGPLASLLNLPAPLLMGAGLALLPYAAAVAWLGTRAAPAPALVRAVIAVNLLWVVDSMLLLVLGPLMAGLAPGALGVAFVLAQAMVVLGFAIAQWAGLRRSAATPAQGGSPEPGFA